MQIELKALSEDAALRARARWNNVAKPLHSMGAFEDMLVKIAAVQGSADISLSPRCVLVFCGDHGVVAEGVSQSGSEVTAAVARSVARGESNINVLASCAGADVFAVDMGMKTALWGENILDCRQGSGTQDFVFGRAMSLAQAEAAIEDGMALVEKMRLKGYKLIATGEMGIGNTTASAALACALTGAPVETMVCRGSGLSDRGLEKKKQVIAAALKKHESELNDPLRALAALGGFELAGMVGAFLGGARWGVPVVIDGVISAVCALTAARICPRAVDYMLPSHMSGSAAAAPVFRELGLQSVIDARMALGEGTGAVMLLPLLDMAKRLYDSAHTFESLAMEAYTPQ